MVMEVQRRTKVKILSNNIEPEEEPQVEERIRTADNLHSQTHPPANGDSNFKIPLSPPGLPNQPRTATSPRSAPRGGRYYKQLDSTAPVGIHSVSIDSSLPPSSFAHQNMSFNKAVESIAALKLHNFAMKRKQQITQRLRLLREIKSLEKENEEEYYLQQKRKQDLTLAAWKLRYYIEYLRLVSLQHVVEAIEEKNAFLEKDFQEHELRNESLKQEIADLKQALERKDQLVFESEEAVKQLQSTVQVMDLDLEMTKQELSKQHRAYQDLEIQQEEERQRHAEELLTVEQTRKELEITRLTCQEMVRAAAQQKTEIDELQKTIESHNSVVEEQAKEHQQVLDTQQVLIENLQKSHQNDLEKIKDLENQLESQIDQKNEAVLAFEGQIYDLQTQKDELQQEKHNIETEFAKSDEKIKKVEDEKASLQKVLTNMAIQLQESEAVVAEQKLLSEQQLLIHQELQNQLRSQEEVIREFQQQEVSYQEQVASFQALVKELLPTIENSMMRAEDYFEHMRQSSILAERKTEYARYLEEELFHARRYYPYTAASNTAGTEIEYEEDAFEQEQEQEDPKTESYDQNNSQVLPMNDSAVENEKIPEETATDLLVESQVTINDFETALDPEEILKTQKLVANDVVSHVLSDASHHISDLSVKIARSISPVQNTTEVKTSKDEIENKEILELSNDRAAPRAQTSQTTRKRSSSGGGSANGKRRANSVPLHSQQTNAPPQIQAVEEKLTTLMKTLDDKLSSIDQVTSTLKVLVEKAESLERAQTPQPVVPPSPVVVAPVPAISTASSSLKVETIPEEQEDASGIGSVDNKIERVMSEITLNTFPEGARSRELVLQNVEEVPTIDDVPNNDSLSVSSKAVRVEDQINLEKLYQEMTKAAEEMNQELYYQQEAINALQELRSKMKNEQGFITHQLTRGGKNLSDEQRQSLEQMRVQYRQQIKQLKTQINLSKQSQQDLTVKLIELQAEMFHIHQDIYNNGQEFNTLYKEDIFSYYPEDLIHVSPVKVPPSRTATKQQTRSPTAKERSNDGAFIGESAFDLPERLLGSRAGAGFSASYSTMMTDEIAAMSATYERNHQTLLTLMELGRISPTGSFVTIDTEQTSKEDEIFPLKPTDVLVTDLPISNLSSPEVSTPKRKKSEKLEKKASKRFNSEPLVELREEDEEKRTGSAESKTHPTEIIQPPVSTEPVEPNAIVTKLEDPSLTSATTRPDVINYSSIASQPTVPIESVLPANVEHTQPLPAHLETTHVPIVEHASPWSPPRSPATFTNAKAPRGLKSASFQRKFEFQKRQQHLREQFLAMKIELERLASTLVNHLETMPILLETRQEVYQEIDGWREQFYELCGVYPDENDQHKSKVYQTLIEAYRETDSQLAVTSDDYKTAYDELQHKIGEIIPIQDELYHLMQNTSSSFSASASSAIPLEKEDFVQAYSSFLTLEQLIAQYTPRPIFAPSTTESEDTSLVAVTDEKVRPASALESSLMSIPETSLETSSEVIGVSEEKKDGETVMPPSLFEQMHNLHLNQQENITTEEVKQNTEQPNEIVVEHQSEIPVDEKVESKENKEESHVESVEHVEVKEDVINYPPLVEEEHKNEETKEEAKELEVEAIVSTTKVDEKEIPSIANESSVYSMSFEESASIVLNNKDADIKENDPESTAPEVSERSKEEEDKAEEEIQKELQEKEEEIKKILSELSVSQTDSFLRSSLSNVVDRSVKLKRQEEEKKEKQQKEQTRRMSNVQATSFIASMMTSLPSSIKMALPVTTVGEEEHDDENEIKITEKDEIKENQENIETKEELTGEKKEEESSDAVLIVQKEQENVEKEKEESNNEETSKNLKSEDIPKELKEEKDDEKSVTSHPPSDVLDSHQQSHDHHVAFDEKVVVLPHAESEDDIDESEIWQLTATTATSTAFLLTPTTTHVEVEVKPDSSSEKRHKGVMVSEDEDNKESEEYSSAGMLTTYLSTTDDDLHLTTTTTTAEKEKEKEKEKVLAEEQEDGKGDDNENYEDDNDFASIEQDSLSEDKRKKAAAITSTPTADINTTHQNTYSPGISSSAFAFSPISSNQPSVELDTSSILSHSPNHLNSTETPIEQSQPSRKEATMAQLNAMVAEYQVLKAELKTWRDGFYAKHKREPNITDFNTLRYDLKVKIARKNQLKKILNNYKHLNLNLTGGDENSEKINNV